MNPGRPTTRLTASSIVDDHRRLQLLFLHDVCAKSRKNFITLNHYASLHSWQARTVARPVVALRLEGPERGGHGSAKRRLHMWAVGQELRHEAPRSPADLSQARFRRIRMKRSSA